MGKWCLTTGVFTETEACERVAVLCCLALSVTSILDTDKHESGESQKQGARELWE